jgi:hypothetical protein
VFIRFVNFYLLFYNSSYFGLDFVILEYSSFEFGVGLAVLVVFHEWGVSVDSGWGLGFYCLSRSAVRAGY